MIRSLSHWEIFSRLLFSVQCCEWCVFCVHWHQGGVRETSLLTRWSIMMVFMNWKMIVKIEWIKGKWRHKHVWACPCFIENVFTNLTNVLLKVITARTGYRGNYDCFHTRAKCAIWMIIRTAQFELHSVHTRSNCDIWIMHCTRETEFAVYHSSAEDAWLMSGYPVNQTCTELAFPVLLYIMQHMV